MADPIHLSEQSQLVRLEPEDRLVVLARTIQARDPGAEAALEDMAVHRTHFGDTCLGQALYRHRSVFRNASEAPAWSHLELRYFRDIIPADVIRELVTQQLPQIQVLRAEVLVTTPSSFVVPRDWQGSADRTERQASLEYIDVQPASLGEYRDIMRTWIGPAAARLVLENRIGTFRAMETAVVLYRDPALKIEWNQIHLCEVDPNGFSGFSAPLQEVSPNGGLTDVFAGLDRIRRIPRWTFNEPVVEADAALGRVGAVYP